MSNRPIIRMGKACATVLIAALVMTSAAGCGRRIKNAEGTVATFDKNAVSADLAQFMIRYEQYIFETQSWDYLTQIYGSDVNLWEIDIAGDGSSFWESMKKQRMEDLKKLLLAEKHAEDAGVTEDDYGNSRKKIAETSRKFISSLDKNTAKALCATEETVSEYLRLMTIQSVVEDRIADTVDHEVSDDEARQVSVEWAAFPKSGDYTASAGNGETETEDVSGYAAETEPDTENVIENSTEAETGVSFDTAKEEAEAFLKSVPDADGFDAAFHAFTEKYADSPVTEDGYTFGAEDTYPASALISASVEIKEDNTVIDKVIEGEDAYYVVLVTDAFNDDATAQKKEEIVEDRELSAISEKYAEWEKDCTWKVNDDVLSKIRADRHFAAPEEVETDVLPSETENDVIVSYAETEDETEAGSAAETAGIETEAETETSVTEGGN